jgi:hypothetical protein
MKPEKESKVFTELRRIRDDKPGTGPAVLAHSHAEGGAWTMKQEKEPLAIRELRRIRQEMVAEEKRVGSDKYWAEANQQGREFARKHGLKYVESPSSAYGLHDKPEGRKGKSGKRING